MPPTHSNNFYRGKALRYKRKTVFRPIQNVNKVVMSYFLKSPTQSPSIHNIPSGRNWRSRNTIYSYPSVIFNMRFIVSLIPPINSNNTNSMASKNQRSRQDLSHCSNTAMRRWRIFIAQKTNMHASLYPISVFLLTI